MAMKPDKLRAVIVSAATPETMRVSRSASRATLAARAAGLVVLVALAAAWPSRALAGPFPPIAAASATPEEPTALEVVAFSSAGSLDPDDAPAPLTFAWDFDDGATSTEASPTHAFAAAGAYRVRLVVSDGASTTEAGVTVIVLAPPAAVSASWSSPLALVEARQELWVVNDDAGSVTVLSTDTLAVLTELAVCDEPSALTLLGDAIFVGCAGSGEVVRVDVPTREVVTSRRIATRIGGLVATVDGRVLATLPSDGAVVALSSGDLIERSRVVVGGEPRAIARDGSGTRAFVVSFLSRGTSGTVTRIDLGSWATEVFPLAMDPGPDSPSSSRGLPNVLGALVIDPAAETLWVGGLKSNVERGLSRDGLPLTPDTRVRGIMTPIDLGLGSEVLERRIDTNDADAVSAIAFSPRGRFAYVTHPGIGAVSTYDLASLRLFSPGRGATVPFRSRIEVGDRPDGIVVSADGTRAYVRAALSRAVVALDLGVPATPEVIDSIEVVAEVLAPDVALGRRLFTRSRAPVHSRSGYVACASCHPGGGHDGQTWDFTHAGEGLRNTIDLRGHGGTRTGPVHWSANFDEVEDFENDIVTGFGGTGLAGDGLGPNAPLGAPNAGRSADLDALGAYVESLLTAPVSPYRLPDGELTEGARRGAAVFERAGCATCHSGPFYTDSSLRTPFVLHDVGTLGPGSGSRLGGALEGIDTPSLLGAWGSAPYFHDGSTETLEALLERDLGDRHGVTSTLTAGDRTDLAEFLRQLDRPGSTEASVSGCNCRARARRPRGEGPWMVVAAVALARTVVTERRRRGKRGVAPSRRTGGSG